MNANHITPAVQALIGVRSDWVEAPHPVQESEVRRFFQGTMDHHPRYYDAQWAACSRYKVPVAPPGFVLHLFRRPPQDMSDPFTQSGDPDFDGVTRQFRTNLPRVPIALAGVLNAGYAHKLYSYAAIGEWVKSRCLYRDIYQREGKSGSMVCVVVEDEYQTREGRPLMTFGPHADHAVIAMDALYFDDVAEGAELPGLTEGPLTSAHIMRWSAATENWHPLHYDWKYATEHDGLPDVLVSGSWKQHFLLRLLTEWAGETGWLLNFDVQLRGMNVPGDTLTAWGRVTGKRERNGFGLVDVAVGVKNQNGVESTPGTATVVLQLRGGKPVPYPFEPALVE